MTAGLSASEKRVLNPRPFRHYRKRYSLTEVRLGVGVLAVLALVCVWVSWRGAHADPELFADPKSLLAPGRAPVERGELPSSLAPSGWKEGALSRFDAANLYEKIDGRADYFLSRGFRSLAAVTLTKEGAPATAVDVELYDLGSPENAASVFGGEKPPDVAANEAGGTSWYAERNALFVARGTHYVRAIGSDEGADVKAALVALRARFEGLAASERPFGYTLLASVGVPSDKVSFQEENAFSFGFARGVYIGVLPDGDTELFVMPAADAASARDLAKQFEQGFLGYGEAVRRGPATWVKDRYLASYARAVVEGSMVVGVRGAAAVASAEKSLEALRKAVAVLPADVLARAARRSTERGGPSDGVAATAPAGGDPASAYGSRPEAKR